MTALINQEFISGTTITSSWLNGVNDHVNAIESTTGAGLVGVTPSGTISSTKVQGALQELDTDIQSHISDVTNAHEATSISYQQGSTGSVVRNTGDKLRESVSVKDFGAIGDGVHDDTVAIQAAITYAQAPTGSYLDKEVFFPPGMYNVSTPLVLKHGTEANHALLLGYGATLYCTAAISTVIDIVAAGAVNYQWIGQTHILGLRIECAGVAQRGITIGTGLGIDGVFPSIIRDVDIRDYTIAGITITDSRLWQLNSVTVQSSTSAARPLVFHTTATGKTCVDHWVTNCQFVVPAASAAACIYANIAAGSIGGLHFTDVVCYGVLAFLNVTDTGTLSDIFFTQCAQDGMGKAAYAPCLSITAATSNKIKDVFINSCWFNAGYSGIEFQNVANAQLRGGKVSSTDLFAVRLTDCLDTVISDVAFYDVNTSNNGGGAINLGAAGSRNKVIGCSVFNAAGHSNVICLIGATQLKPVVVGNTTDAGIFLTNNNLGVSGTDYYYAGNLS